MAGTDNLVSWKPGQSGNPGGKTSEQRKLEAANAEKATRIRAALLDKVMELVDAGMAPELEANLLKLIKDSEDRGLGAPRQPVDNTHDVSGAMQEAVREFNGRIARVAARSRKGGDPS